MTVKFDSDVIRDNMDFSIPCPCGSGLTYGDCHASRLDADVDDDLVAEARLRGFPREAAERLRQVFVWVVGQGARGGPCLVSSLVCAGLAPLGLDPRPCVGYCVNAFGDEPYEYSWVEVDGRVIDLVPSLMAVPSLDGMMPVVGRDVIYGSFAPVVYGVTRLAPTPVLEEALASTPLGCIDAFLRFCDGRVPDDRADLLGAIFGDGFDVDSALDFLEGASWDYVFDASWDAVNARVAMQRAIRIPDNHPWAIEVPVLAEDGSITRVPVLSDPDFDPSASPFFGGAIPLIALGVMAMPPQGP